MQFTQAISVLPLLFAPLTLAAPLIGKDVCTLGRTPVGGQVPDNASQTYFGYTGEFTGRGFPYIINGKFQGQPAVVSPARLEDTVRRALGASPVANSAAQYQNPKSVESCKDATTDIYQGTTYVGSLQIFVTISENDVNGKPIVDYCGYETFNTEVSLQSDPNCGIPLDKNIY